MYNSEISGEKMKLEINNNIKDTYPVYIEKGSINEIKKYISFSHKNLLLTDDLVPTEYVQKILAATDNVCVCTCLSGEVSKSFATYQSILQVLFDNEFDKDDLLIALGGGVIGDLGGFVASTYKRGMRFINVPTTSLAMVDSSIGGKNGINFLDIKNSIGSFYNPEMVIIDVDVLKTLPQRHLVNGLIEAIKCGLIGDKGLFNLFKKLNGGDYDSLKPHLEEIIIRSLNVKKKVVEADLYDTNERRILNFGHTYGHAIEALNINDILHGEAVALGMLYVLNDDLKEELIEILSKLGFKVDFTLLENEKIHNKIIHDKKIKNGKINLVKVDNVGKAYIEEVDIEKIK